MIAQSRGEKVFNGLNIVLLAMFAMLAVYPFLYTLGLSLSSQAEASRDGLHVFPGNPDDMLRTVSGLIRGEWQPPGLPLSLDDVSMDRVHGLINSVGRDPTDPVGTYLRAQLPRDLVENAARYSEAYTYSVEALPPQLLDDLLAALNSYQESAACDRDELAAACGPLLSRKPADELFSSAVLRDPARLARRILEDRSGPCAAIRDRYTREARLRLETHGFAKPEVPRELVAEIIDGLNRHVLLNRKQPLWVRPGTAPFSIADMEDPASIAGSLANHLKPHTQFLFDCLSREDRQLISAYEPPSSRDRKIPPEEVPLLIRRVVLRALNAAAEDHGDIYTRRRFRLVPGIPEDIKATIPVRLEGEEATVRNRLLIQCMYTSQLWKQDEKRFHAVSVQSHARALSKHDGLIDMDFRRMNRLLLRSAYPGIFTAPLGAVGYLAQFLDGITLSSYRMVLQNRDIYIGYANTIFRTVVATFLVVMCTAIAAFPLARKDLPHRGVIIFILLITMLFGGGLVPGFLLIRNIGLYNSRWVYIIPGLLNAFNIILIKNFFQSVPDSLHESAMMDGASEWRILFQIYIPLSKPVLATVALWTAVAHWNEWFTPLIYIDDHSKQVLQYFLQRIVINNQTDLIERGLLDPDAMSFTSETIKAAMVLVTMIPILCFYPFVQKYFVKGIRLGSVKE